MKATKENVTSKSTGCQTTNSEWRKGNSIFSLNDNSVMLSVQVPRTLNSWVLIETYPPTSVPNWSMDIICYIVHLIQKEENITTYPITRDTLLKFEIPDSDEYIDYLLKTNVIAEIKQYKREKEIISYKLTPRYSCPCVSQVIFEPRLIEAIKRYNDKQASLIESKYPYLMKWLESDKLYIDDFQADLYNENNLIREYISSCFQNEISSYNSQKIIIKGIVNRNLYLEYNENNGDINTLFNSLPEELEEYLRYDNKELVSISVNNSSTKLSTLFLDKEKIRNPIIQASIAKINPKFQKTANFEELVDFISLHQDNADVIEYQNLALDSHFYNALTHKVDEQGLDITHSTHQQLEFVFNAVHLTINAKNALVPHIAETNFFTTAFPTVSLIFEKIKENEKDNASYLTLEKALDDLRIDLFLNRICKRISDENPNIPIFYKYDSIITTSEHRDFVATIINEEFKKVLGIPPVYSIEHW